MILYVIRHGSPDYENDSLTEIGYKQAAALSERFIKEGITKVYSSPNGRAIMTAQPTCYRLNLDIAVRRWLSEDLNSALAHEEGSGRDGWYFDIPFEEAKSDETLSFGDEWYKAPAYATVRDGERRYNEIVEGSDNLLEELGYKRCGRGIYRVVKKSDEKVAVFCHDCTGTTWIAQMLGIPAALFGRCFGIATTGVTKLHFGNEETKEGDIVGPECEYFSDISHKYKADLPK